MRCLLTGGSGFVGQHLARRLVEAGWRVRVLVRPSSNRRPLEELGVSFTVGDLTDGTGLAAALEEVDCVFHLAGVTKARTAEEYHRCNTEGTRRLAQAMAQMTKPARLVYCSSLAAAGPAVVGRPRREEDTPTPVSTYGRSKLGGEIAVRAVADRVPSVIFRPPIVYGPEDKEFLPTLWPMMKLGLALKSGFGQKEYSLIHVDDLCTALIQGATLGSTVSQGDPASGVYFVSDGGTYRYEEVCHALSRAMGQKRLRVLPIPEVLGYPAALGAWIVASVTGSVPALNFDKAKELSCAAWTCSPQRAAAEMNWTAAMSLQKGFEGTVSWYRREGLL